MATSTADLELRTTLNDQASSKVQGMGMSFAKLTGAIALGTIAADAFKKGLDFVTSTLEGSIEAAKEAQVSDVKVNAILKTLGETITYTSKKTTEHTTQVGLSRAEIDKINISITTKEHALTALNNKLKAGKISHVDYADRVAATKLQIIQLNDKLDSTTSKHTKVNQIVTLGTISMKAATDAVEAAGRAALKLGFDDEDAHESMAKLLQVTRDTKLATEASNEAMDLARFKGISLSDATQALTMAMNGNVRVLKQLGIEVPDNADKMTVLGLVHDRVAGQAAAYAKTAAGAQDIFRQALENVQEAIGGRVLPIFTKFFTALSTFVTSDTFKKWLNGIFDAFNRVSLTITDIVIPIFQDKLNTTLTDTRKLLHDLKGNGSSGIDGLTGSFSMIEVALSPLIGLVVSFNFVIDKAIKLVDAFINNKTINSVSGGIENVINGVLKLFGQPPIPTNHKKAGGGMVNAGQPYIVGERGQEMFVPASNGTIVPNGRMGGGSNITINVGSVRNDNDLSQIIAAVQRETARALKLSSMGV